MTLGAGGSQKEEAAEAWSLGLFGAGGSILIPVRDWEDMRTPANWFAWESAATPWDTSKPLSSWVDGTGSDGGGNRGDTDVWRQMYTSHNASSSIYQ